MAHRLAHPVGLITLLAAIKRSPIVVMSARLFGGSARVNASEWARIRNSSEVDAFVLAWIAGHVQEPSRRRLFM
jgi:hypothetical protein